MNKTQKTLNILSLIFNIAIVASTIYATSSFYSGFGAGNMKVHGTECFQFFTVDSNILAGICSLIMLFFNIKRIKNVDTPVPKGFQLFKFAGTVAVTLTFITVVAFLGPTMGYELMFEGPCLYMHLTTPILAIITFCVFEAGDRLSAKQALTGVIPTIIYGAVYFTMVIIVGVENGGWNDFYGFNSGFLEGRWYISIVAMPAFTYIFSLALKALHAAVTNKLEKKQTKSSPTGCFKFSA